MWGMDTMGRRELNRSREMSWLFVTETGGSKEDKGV